MKTKVTYLIVGFIACLFYIVACGGSTKSIPEAIGDVADDVVQAASILYTNAQSGLEAVNVQDAIDEVVAHINTATGTIGTALDILYDNATSKLSATTVQSAIDEVAASVDSIQDTITDDGEPSDQNYGTITKDKLVGQWKSTCYVHQWDDSEPYEFTTCTNNVTFNEDGTFDVDASWPVLALQGTLVYSPCDGITPSGLGGDYLAEKYQIIEGAILMLGRLRPMQHIVFYDPIFVKYIGENKILTSSDYYTNPSRCILIKD